MSISRLRNSLQESSYNISDKWILFSQVIVSIRNSIFQRRENSTNFFILGKKKTTHHRTYFILYIWQRMLPSKWRTLPTFYKYTFDGVFTFSVLKSFLLQQYRPKSLRRCSGVCEKRRVFLLMQILSVSTELNTWKLNKKKA